LALLSKYLHQRNSLLSLTKVSTLLRDNANGTIHLSYNGNYTKLRTLESGFDFS